MRLRIYRTWSWVLNCSPYEVRYGGDNPMKLVSSDVLQYFDGEEWRDVEVVEEEKPEHPRKAEQRKEYEKMQKSWDKIFKDLPGDTKLENLAELIRKS